MSLVVVFAIQIGMGAAYLINGLTTNTVHQIVLGPVIIILGILLLRKALAKRPEDTGHNVKGKTG